MANDEEEFLLGGQVSDEETFSLGSENDAETVKRDEKDPLAPIEIGDFYNDFVEPYINSKDDFSNSFESEIEIFDAFGLKRFIKFNEIDKTKLKERLEFYRAAAKDRFDGKDEFSRIESFLSQARDFIFKNEKSYRDKMLLPLWKRQFDILYGKIDAYGTDKVISTKEYSELLKQVEELGLDNLDDKYRYTDKQEEKKTTKDLIEEYAKKKGYDILSADKEFTNELEAEFNRNEKNRADTKKNRQRYFNLYDKLKNNVGETASEDDMDSLMKKEGLELLPKVEVFVSVNKDKLSQKDESSNYYVLADSAKSEFEFSEGEWNDFCKENGIEKPKEQKPNFYIGKGHVESIEDIPALMDENKADVNINTIIGQLNGIGRNHLSEKIEAAQKDYSDAPEAIFEKTKYILNSNLPPNGFSSCDYLEIAKKLESDEEYYKHNLIGTKNSSLQLWLETRRELGFDADEIEFVKNAIVSDPSPYEKRLNKVILSLEDNNFRIDGNVFNRPIDIVDNADADTKNKIVEKLLNFNSKIFCWIEKKFNDLVKNVEFWASNERKNEVTLSYALEQKAPFHFGSVKLDSVAEMEIYILQNIQSKSFLNELIDPKFLEELDFWEENYQKTNVLATFIPVLFSMSKDISYKETFDDFATFLENQYLSNELFSFYLGNFIPLFLTAIATKLIDEGKYEKHKKNLFDFLSQNQNDNTNDSVKEFIESIISLREESENFEFDTPLLIELFRYYFNITIDRNYYEQNIHPILEKSVALELVPASILEDERKFFVSKYISELGNADYKTQCELFDSIEKLDAENPVLLHFKNSREKALVSIRKENFFKKCSNSAKRNFAVFCATVIFAAATICAGLRFLLPMFVDINDITLLLLNSGKLMSVCNFLISTQRGNFVLAALLLLLFVKPLAGLLYNMKSKKVKDTVYGEIEGSAVIRFVINNIQNSEKPEYTRKLWYNVSSLVLRIFLGILTFTLAGGMIWLCLMNKWIFILFGLYSLMVISMGNVFEDLNEKITASVSEKTFHGYSIQEDFCEALMQKAFSIKEFTVFIPCALFFGNFVMKIVASVIWGIPAIIRLVNFLKAVKSHFSVLDLLGLCFDIAALVIFWLVPSLFIYSAIFVFVYFIAVSFVTVVLVRKYHKKNDNLLEILSK